MIDNLRRFGIGKSKSITGSSQQCSISIYFKFSNKKNEPEGQIIYLISVRAIKKPERNDVVF